MAAIGEEAKASIIDPSRVLEASGDLSSARSVAIVAFNLREMADVGKRGRSNGGVGVELRGCRCGGCIEIELEGAISNPMTLLFTVEAC